MKFASWRRKVGKTQAEVAEALGCSQSYVSQIERAVNPIIPGAAVIIEIYLMTAGEVQPNDFYELPPLQRDRKAA